MGKNQGEGDRESARHYEERTKEFVESGKVGPAADKAKQGKEDPEAERQGQERAREYDPNVHREYDKPEK